MENTTIDKEYAEEVLSAANRYFCNGLYVKTDDIHPCGWDFIELAYFEDVDETPISLEDINDGIYYQHPYAGLTVLELLKTVGREGFCFEMSGVDRFE